MNQRLAILGGLFLLFLVVLLAVPPSGERQPSLTVYSAEPGGGKALRLWLDALGYRVTTLEGSQYAIGRDISTVLVLAPSQFIGPGEAGELERWVRRGGRLIVSADSVWTWELLRRFDVQVSPLVGVSQAVPAAPGRLDPAITTVSVSPRFHVRPAEGDNGQDRLAPLLVGQSDQGGQPGPILAASVPVERGEVIVLTVTDALANEALRDDANARLALSLIGPPGLGQVAFDELHHGFGSLERRNIYALLLDQAWGRVSLLACGLVLVFLLLRGRRLGRSIPVFVDRGRSLGELVTSQASLYRAGGKRAFVADHLARQLRHDLARAVGLPGDASDEQIAARARMLGRDPAPALRLLTETPRARSDRALLALTREGAEVYRSLSGAPSPAANAPSPRGSPRVAETPPLPRTGEGVGG